MKDDMKVLITGGCGYIGSHLTEYLSQRDVSVIVVDKKENNIIDLNNVIYCIFDILDTKKLYDVLKTESIDCIIHCAGELGIKRSYAQKKFFYKQNTFLTQCVLDAMVNNDVKNIIFSSSAAVYDDSSFPLKENDNISSLLSPYSAGKIASEYTLKGMTVFGINYLAFRYFNVIGCSRNPILKNNYLKKSNILPLLVNSYKHNKPFYVFGNQYKTHDGTCVRDYIDIEDLCQLHYLALTKIVDINVNDVFNAGSGRGYSVKEILEIFNNTVSVDIKPIFSHKRDGDASLMVADINKTSNYFEWQSKKTIVQSIENLLQDT